MIALLAVVVPLLVVGVLIGAAFGTRAIINIIEQELQ